MESGGDGAQSLSMAQFVFMFPYLFHPQLSFRPRALATWKDWIMHSCT